MPFRIRMCFGVLGAAFCCAAAGGGAWCATPIEHIIIVTQENRTVDNLFHGLKAFLPAADVATEGPGKNGETIELMPARLEDPFDMSHAYVQFRTQYNNGYMDGNDGVMCTTANAQAVCPPHPGYTYILRREVQPYFDMAINYGFANRMFQTNRGPSLPAHLELLSGTGAPSANSNLFDGNIYNLPVTPIISGCTSIPEQTLQLIGPNGEIAQNVFPCFEHATLTDLLDAPPAHPAAPISWRYYTASNYGILNATNAIRHMCQPAVVGDRTKCTGPHFKDGSVVTGPQHILSDITAGNLATVNWVNPYAKWSDHPIGATDEGPSWVAAIVNTVGNSPYWANTVIFVTWDDWGGFYDHVPPPNDLLHGYYEYGFRVPLLVISPYAKPGYVSTRTHDFGSILKFVERTLDLPLIPPGNFADSRSDDLSDFFDFTAPPRAFVPVSAKYPPSYFLSTTIDAAHPPDDPD